MKKLVFSLFILTLFALISTAQVFSPYTLGATSNKGLKESAALIGENLTANGFQILGEYAPAEDNERWLIVITSESLLYAAGKTGGLSGFAAALRVALTRESGRVLISYTTPEYWLNAYYRDDYEAIKALLDPLNEKLEKVMQESGTYAGTGFGSEKGLDVDDLRSYKYMIGILVFEGLLIFAILLAVESRSPAGTSLESGRPSCQPCCEQTRYRRRSHRAAPPLR